MRVISLLVAVTVLANGCGSDQPSTDESDGQRLTAAETAGLVGEWEVTAIDGTAVLERAVPTIDFGADGTVAGNASCNNFSTTYGVRDDVVTFGPAIATTRKACVPEISDQEAAMLTVLDQITDLPGVKDPGASFVIANDELVLTTRDGATLKARRP